MTQTIGGAVAKRDTGPQALIRQYRDDFAIVLPSHLRADTWVRVAQGLLRRDPKLRAVAESNPGSFMSALLECARLGLEPGVTFHLVPFGNEVQGIEDYTGLVELMFRAGAVESVKAEIVYTNDRFHYSTEMDRPEHTVDWFGDRGEMIGAYAYATLRGGATSRIVVMSKTQIEDVKKVSKTANRSDSPWQRWPDRMWLKTVVKQLEKWVPSSPEWITHKVQAERAGEQAERELSPTALALPAPIRDDEIIDGDIVSPPAAAPAPAQPPRPAPAHPDPEPDARISRPQRDHLYGLLRDGAVNSRDRELRLRIVSRILNRPPAQPVTSFDDLTAAEAETVNAFLARHKADGDLTHTLAELGALTETADDTDTTTEGNQP